MTVVTDGPGQFKGCSRNYPGGAQTLFCPVGGGCFVDNVSEGWGVEG